MKIYVCFLKDFPSDPSKNIYIFLVKSLRGGFLWDPKSMIRTFLTTSFFFQTGDHQASAQGPHLINKQPCSRHQLYPKHPCMQHQLYPKPTPSMSTLENHNLLLWYIVPGKIPCMIPFSLTLHDGLKCNTEYSVKIYRFLL